MHAQATPRLTLLEIVTALFVVVAFALVRTQWPQLE
jgi:hypothetical protein